MLPLRLDTHRYAEGFTPSAEHTGVYMCRGEQVSLVLDQVELDNPLFVRFINCRSDDDLLKFADRYWDQAAFRMSDLRKAAEELEVAAGLSISTKPERLSSERNPRFVNYALEDARLHPKIERVESGEYRLILASSSTATFMALEIATAFEVGAKMAACEQCEKKFLFGPHTGRRSHGRYCSDRCRVAAMRARNAEKEDSK